MGPMQETKAHDLWQLFYLYAEKKMWMKSCTLGVLDSENKCKRANTLCKYVCLLKTRVSKCK